jgi:hypothetical protein
VSDPERDGERQRDHEQGDSPVEEYLDRLLAAAPGPPREVRALLAEAEAHLRDVTAEGQARGLGRHEAERQAVARFGPVRSVAAGEARRHLVGFPVLIRQTVASGLLLGAIGGMAVGISGILAAVMAALGGSTFIVDISSATRLAPSDCARWLSQDPSAHSCYQAALSDWTAEVIGYRLVVGMLGLMAMAAYVLARRHWTRHRRFATLPAPVSDTVALVLFGLSGLWALGLGIDWVAQGQNGAGQWLAAAPVALAVAGYFGFRLLGDLRTAGTAAS